MKVVLLAGGIGSRLSEETSVKPKPMVEIGGRPILWHIMKTYAQAGFCDFVVALGYKGECIERYFSEEARYGTGRSVDPATDEATRYGLEPPEDWTVTLVDTGLETGTGGRLRRLAPYCDGTFMATYGDGLSDVDFQALLGFHRSHGKLATLTAVRPPARFGVLELYGDAVLSMTEKPRKGGGWINGGFFVLEPGALEYVAGDDVDFSREPLERLAGDGQLMAYRHEGFWQCMDTLPERVLLEELWACGAAPWKSW